MIKSNEEYKLALKRIGEILDSKEGTSEYRELLALTLYVSDFEKKNCKIFK